MWGCFRAAWCSSLNQATKVKSLAMLSSTFLPLPQSESHLRAWSPHALALNCISSLGLGTGDSSSGAAAGSEWDHLLLSQKISTRSGPEQPSLDRKHTQATSFRSEGWAHSSREPSSMFVPGDVRVSELALWAFCRCFIHGTSGIHTRWQRGRWTFGARLCLIFSYKAFGKQTHPFSWTGFYGSWANHNGRDTGVGWEWGRAPLEISLQGKIPGNSLSLLSSTVILRIMENLVLSAMQEER